MASVHKLLTATLCVSFPLRLVADIPVHCTQFQILGKWRFHVGEWKDGDPLCGGMHPDRPDGHHDLTPPVRDPSNKEGGPNGYWLSPDFKEAFTMDAIVKDWRVEVTHVSDGGQRWHPGAPSSHPKGDWTMVYDEGWNMQMEADDMDPNLHSMFAFSKYTLHPGEDAGSTDNVANKQHSHCDHTLLGWYKIHDKGSLAIKKHMCYWGERIEHLYPALLEQHEAQMPPQGALVYRKPLQRRARDEGTGSTLDLGPSSQTLPMLEPTLAGTVEAGNPPPLESRNCPGGICDGEEQASKEKKPQLVDREAAKQRLRNISIGKYATMVQQSLETSTGDNIHSRNVVAHNTSHAVFAEAYREPSKADDLLNRYSPPPTFGLPALPGFSSEQILGPVAQRAISEQEQIAKKRGYSSTKQLTPEDMHEHWGPPAKNHHMTRTFYIDGSKLGPSDWRTRANFDWRHVSAVLGNETNNSTITGFVAPVPDQGACGSCYVVAATSMLTARLMLRYPELYHQRFMDGDRVSWHQHLDCNQYVQGCEGGYPMLVSRWGFENDLVLKSCVAAAGRGTECSYANPECQDDRFRIRHFRYVGGSFGRCGSKRLCEAAVREELYKGGPMVVSVEPTSEFNSYMGGMMHRIKAFPAANTEKADNGDKDCTATECYTWRKIDHSVLLTGWGEDSRYGRYCMPLPDEEAEMEGECKLHKDSEEECRAAGCHFGGFPYWTIQNSWTETWGDNGYLTLGPRGKNPLMIEMMAVSADIVRKEELSNVFEVKEAAKEQQSETTPGGSQSFLEASDVDSPGVFGSARGIVRMKDLMDASKDELDRIIRSGEAQSFVERSVDGQERASESPRGIARMKDLGEVAPEATKVASTLNSQTTVLRQASRHLRTK